MKAVLALLLALAMIQVAHPALKDGAEDHPSPLKGAPAPASTSVDSMRVAQGFNPGRNDAELSGFNPGQASADSNIFYPDTTIAQPDSVRQEQRQNSGIFNRLLKPLAVTALAGGLLLLLFSERGH